MVRVTAGRRRFGRQRTAARLGACGVFVSAELGEEGEANRAPFRPCRFAGAFSFIADHAAVSADVLRVTDYLIDWDLTAPLIRLAEYQGLRVRDLAVPGVPFPLERQEVLAAAHDCLLSSRTFNDLICVETT
jgi:hypothetical protein